MSQETAEWLNSMVLVGYTELRGNAWHYQAALQNGEPNHYVGPVPVDDIVRRLFDFEVVSRPLFVQDSFNANGNVPGFVEIDDRQAMVADANAPVPGAVFGLFKGGYQGHAYREWLLTNAERIMGDELKAGSAGLLREGAQAFVSYEMPENRQVDGIEYRPQLLTYTSYDGSLATGYKLTSTITVCDNTFESARSDAGESFRLKHTRYSTGKVLEAREALGILFDAGDEVGKELERLLAIEVSRKQFGEVLDIMVPLTDARGQSLQKRSLTLAENKREGIQALYTHDDRVSPWAGSGFGVVQAFNTYLHHGGIVRGASRAQRNRSNALGNTVADNDNAVIAAMEKVLAAA